MSNIDIQDIINISVKAGEKILDIYENVDFQKTVDFKADDSPLTIADKAANEIIVAELIRLYPDIPVNRYRRLADAVCLARTGRYQRRPLLHPVAGNPAARQQPAAGGDHGLHPAGHTGPALL